MMMKTETLPDGQVILFEQYRLFRRTWKLVLAIALVVTAGVAVYVFSFLKVEYLAVTRALPPNKSGTPLDNLVGGISNTLKDFGLSKLVGKAGSDNGYSRSVLLTSQPLFDSLIVRYNLFTVYDIPKGRYDKVYKKLLDNIVVDISPEGPITVEVYDEDPQRAAKMANDVIAITNVIAREINRLESEPITRYVGDRYTKVRADQERLGAQLRVFMAKSKLYDPETQGPVVGTAVMEAEQEVAVNRTKAEMFEKMFGAEDPRTVQARALLAQSETQSRRVSAGRAGVLNGLSMDKLPASTVEYLRIREDYEVNAKVLAFLEPMYEQAKYDEVRNIPVLNVLDPARVPQEKARPKRSIIIASAFIGTILVAYLLIALLAYVRNFKRRVAGYEAEQAAIVAPPERPHAGELNP